MDFRGDQDGSSTKTGRSSSLTHPISLHSLDEPDGSHSDIFAFLSKVQHFAVSVDEETWIDHWELVLESHESGQLEEAPAKLEQVDIHFVTEVD